MIGALQAAAIRQRARKSAKSREPTTSKGAAGEAGLAVAVLASVALPLPYLLRFDYTHVVTATALGLVLFGISLYSRRAGLIATAIFLAFLGDYRRYAGYFQGYPNNDPLLLVAPAAATFLFVCALLDKRVNLSTGLAKLVTLLMLLMFLQVFNPSQGGLQVGFAGALFYLVPLLWFWLGRSYATVEFMEYFTFRVLLSIGLLATLWGLYQTRYGLFAFEQQWVERVEYDALYIARDLARAIGFFTSSAEYTRYLAITAVTLLAAWFARRSRLVVLLPLVLVAIFLAASRGPVVGFVGAAVALWSIRTRVTALWLPRFVIGGAAGVAALVAILLFLQTMSFGHRVDPLVERQVSGLLDPANEKTSTATGHLQMIRDGLVAGLAQPAGQGLGATTIAATKFGARINNAEVDFANIMISLGIVGGLLYLAVIVAVLSKALRWWRAERHTIALVTVAIVGVTFGAWLIGGDYSIAALVWFYIGAMDKLYVRKTNRQLGRSRRRALGVGHA